MNDPRSLDYVTSHRLQLDDRFSFSCHQCGNCCRSRNDLLLSGPDLYRLASVLGMITPDIVKQYCEIYIGRDSHIPMCRVKPVGAQDACPFLRDNRCSVHAAKPTVCALFPLDRGYNSQEKETVYFLQDIPHHPRDKTYTVREWLAENHIPEDNEAAQIWNDMIVFCARFMLENYAKLTPDVRKEIQFHMAVMMYGLYPTRIPLVTLMRDNYSSLTDVLPRLVLKHEYKKKEGTPNE